MSSSTDANYVARSAWQLLQRGDVAAALKRFRRAVRADPTNALALQGMAEALGAAGRYAEALPYAERAVATLPESAECQDALGRILVDLARHEDAAAAFRRAIRRNAAWATPHVHLAEVYVDQDRPAEAQEEYQHALRLDPQDASAWEGFGFCRENAGDYEIAASSYRNSIDLGDDWPRPRWLLARLLLFLGRAREAEKCLNDPAAEQVPNELQAALLAALGSRDKARELVHEAVHSPSDVDWVALGMAYQALGHIKEARRCFEQGADKGERTATDRLKELPPES